MKLDEKYCFPNPLPANPKCPTSARRGSIQDIEIDFFIENFLLEKNKYKGDCHTNCRIIAEALKKKGYEVKIVKGIYYNFPKKIKHSWIEYQDKILETDIRQIEFDNDKFPDLPFATLDKKDFEDRYISILNKSGEQNENLRT